MVGSASGTVAGAKQAPSGDLATDSWPMQRGKIEVAPRAIATIAGRAVAECYGVVGIAARHTRLGAVEMLAPEYYNRGVEVRFANDHITIEVYVVLEHGLRISEIAHNIMEGVKFAVEKALGMRVVQVNVNVQALRVNLESER